MKSYAFLFDKSITENYHPYYVNMKTHIQMKRLLLIILILASYCLNSCKEDRSNNTIVFATSAEYPPFEFYQNGELKGFDIELATLIAQEINKEAKFANMQFSSILASLQTGTSDAAIATITITEERKKNFDFSDTYYNESMSVIYNKSYPLDDEIKLKNKKIACQLGTTMEIWLKKNIPNAEIILMDSNNHAIEALKSGQVEAVIIDTIQAVAFANKNPVLGYNFIANAENGYAIAVKKGSILKDEINNALNILKKNSKLEKLKKKWFEGSEWIS